METAESGDLMLYAQQWINKTSGRGAAWFARLGDPEYLASSYREETERLANWGLIYSPSRQFWELLPESFPWARFQVDEDYYSVFEELGTTDLLVGVSPEGKHVEGLAPHDLRPYDVASAELAEYRYLVSLSEIGQAYLTVERFVELNQEELPSVA